MKAVIKFQLNEEAVNQNRAAIQNTILYNQHHPYSPLAVPKKIYPKYKRTEMSFKVHSIVNYLIEPTKSKDMMINISQYGMVRAEYDPILEQKLELYFNGE